MTPAKDNVHDRHQGPQHDEDFDVQPSGGQTEPAEKKADTKPTKFSWPGKDAKEQQAIRDAHFKEKGVKADGTGGVAPEEEA